MLLSHCNFPCLNYSLAFSWGINICYSHILISCAKCFWDNNSLSSFIAKNRSKAVPLDMHALVCYSINTLVFAVTQCSLLFQKTKEFNNSIDIVCQNTVKKYESSKILNACSPAVFFKIITLITPPSGVLLCTFFFIFQCTWASLQIFMKSFFYKNFLWRKISRVSSLMSTSTLLGFQGTLYEDYNSENQTEIYVFLCISSLFNFSKADIGPRRDKRGGNPFQKAANFIFQSSPQPGSFGYFSMQ